MSVADGLNRVLDIRNGIRSKMVALGLSENSDNFEQVKTSVENIVDNTKKTDTATAIQGTFSSGQVGAIFAKGLKGYSSEASMVKIPVANLAPENIKEGANIGGVVGTSTPSRKYALQYTAGRNNSSSDTSTITDSHGNIIRISQTAEPRTIQVVGDLLYIDYGTVSSVWTYIDCKELWKDYPEACVQITGQNPKIGIGEIIT